MRGQKRKLELTVGEETRFSGGLPGRCQAAENVEAEEGVPGVSAGSLIFSQGKRRGGRACSQKPYSAGKLEKLQSKGEGMTLCRLKVDDGRGDELPRNRRE